MSLNSSYLASTSVSLRSPLLSSFLPSFLSSFLPSRMENPIQIVSVSTSSLKKNKLFARTSTVRKGSESAKGAAELGQLSQCAAILVAVWYRMFASHVRGRREITKSRQTAPLTRGMISSATATPRNRVDDWRRLASATSERAGGRAVVRANAASENSLYALLHYHFCLPPPRSRGLARPLSYLTALPPGLSASPRCAC